MYSSNKKCYEFSKGGGDKSVAVLCSAYKLAQYSTICMKYLTLVFLAALGLDFQAALRAHDNICTPVSPELAFCCFVFKQTES